MMLDDSDRRWLESELKAIVRRLGALEDNASGERELLMSLGELGNKVDTCLSSQKRVEQGLEAAASKREAERREDRRTLWQIGGAIIAALIGAAVVILIAILS